MRNKRLDILRCVAVLAVMFRHTEISALLRRVGWIGVDLFFVLSGFLISGLLFSEYKKRRTISLKRFYIRRGLKIYPAFYVFLFLTGLVSYFIFHKTATPAYYFHDVFFIMNYEHGVWDHTWSLGVEEHFYIFLPIFLLVVARYSSNRRDPFRILPWTTLAVGLLCIVSRAISVDFGTPNFKMAYIASHNRMDALFFGVLLGYFYHFRPSMLEGLMRPRINCMVIGALSAFLLSFAYFFPLEEQSNLFSTIGYTFIYLGFGGVLLLALYVHGILPRGIAWVAERVGSAFAFIGVYSYSIYLWHGPADAWFPGLMRRTIHFPTSRAGVFAAYFISSLAIGIVMSRLIEYPILHLRDRLFPQGQVVAVSPEVPEG
jgi:peptidoglycan/LPS O-acetylase OafA/YrhL